MFITAFYILFLYLHIAFALVIPVGNGDALDILPKEVSNAKSSLQQVLTGNQQAWVPIVFPSVEKDIIPNTYIVIFNMDIETSSYNDKVQQLLQKLPKEDKDSVKLFSIGSLSGFSAILTSDALKHIQTSEIVLFIEADAKIYSSEFEAQKFAPWGLARISHRDHFADFKYLYDNEGGKGVDAYVIDSGIRVEHEEFEGRAKWGLALAYPDIHIDTNGHGTHCAGVIGSKTYGVAKKVNLYAVSVINIKGEGTLSNLIKALEFVVQQHKSKISKVGYKGSTINLSLAGGISEAIDLAVNSAVASGIHIATAAGNSGEDACTRSPARADGPITVGATNIRNMRSTYSNHGKCVDVFAPGEDIESTYLWGSIKLSGTSMSTPHVTGLLSYFLSLTPESSSEYFTGLVEPKQLKEKLLKYATEGIVGNLTQETPNKMIFNGAGQNLTDFWAER